MRTYYKLQSHPLTRAIPEDENWYTLYKSVNLDMVKDFYQEYKSKGDRASFQFRLIEVTEKEIDLEPVSAPKNY